MKKLNECSQNCKNCNKNCKNMDYKKTMETWAMEVDQDKFQSFVCWMLGVVALLALIPPTAVFVYEGSTTGCQGPQFTILSHYGTYHWMRDVFENFKANMSSRRANGESIPSQICYRLAISTSEFDESYNPTIYSPDYSYWINKVKVNQTNIISNTTKYCSPTTDIPIGLITWENYAKSLINMNNNESLMDYLDLVNLSSQGWSLYTTTSAYPINISEFYFTHGHPNTSSAGHLSLVIGAQNILNDTDEQYSYNSFRDNSLINGTFINLKALESNIDELNPNDLSIVIKMINHGNTYLHATIGLENDVAYYNNQSNLISPNRLQFIYFKSTMWMDHPICVLDGASWVNDDETWLGSEFLKYSTSTEQLETLMNYGVRPIGQFSYQGLIKPEYGVDPSFNRQNTIALKNPNTTTISQVLYQFQLIKRPVYLKLVIETSSSLQTNSETKSRSKWSYLKAALPYFAKTLEDNAMIELVCFAQTNVSCSDYTFPYGLLKTLRNNITQFFDQQISVSDQSDVYLYTVLKSAYIELNNTRNQLGENAFNYVMVVVSQETSEDESEFIQLLQSNSNGTPQDIHIYPILFYGNQDSTTGTVMSEIANITNSNSWSARSSIESTFGTVAQYF